MALFVAAATLYLVNYNALLNALVIGFHVHRDQLGLFALTRAGDVATAIGLFATQPKEWLRPDDVSAAVAQQTFEYLQQGGSVHSGARPCRDPCRG